MAKTLELGPKLRLPALEAQTQTLVVYGGKGMGKTNFAAVLAEELAGARLRFSWIDPVGVAWGLRHSSDGRGAGVEVLILGGIHGDLPIEPTAGAIVADLVVDEDVSVIIDISRRSNGTMWSKGEKIKFVRDYCVRLYSRQGERRRPLMQIIDEAGRFVPQMLPKGSSAIDLAECMGAIEELVELGRNVGVGVALFTQRSARMNKSVSELAEMMVAFRTVGPNSIDAILDWFGEHVPKDRQRALVERLRELDVGTALIVSPGWLKLEGEYAIRARQTFDSSSTPRAGQERRASGKGAVVDLEKYRAAMAETIERATADDPRELQKKLREHATERDRLKRELAAALAKLEQRPEPVAEDSGRIAQLEAELANATAVAEQLDAERAAAIAWWEHAHLKFAGGLLDRIHQLHEDALVELADLRAQSDDAAQLREKQEASHAGTRPPAATRPAARDLSFVRERPGPEEARHAAPRPLRPPAEREVGRVSGEPPAAVSKPQQKILNALAWFESVGLSSPRRSILAPMADTSSKSSGFEKNLSTLRTGGFIDYGQNSTVYLTDGGRAIAAPVDAPGDERELQRAVISKVSRPQGALLEALIAAYPAPLTREELADAAGTSSTSSGFEKNLSTLRTLGVIDYPERGYVVALPILFLDEAA
jgi:uncharacterized protein